MLMDTQVLILVVSFLLLLVMNVPVAVAIGVSTLLTILSIGDAPAFYIIAQRMSSGVGSFPLLAIPFFILSGVLMGEGGLARRLIDFAAAIVGRFPGGLSYVNTLTCMLFGSISGSAAAAVSSIGGFMIPEMNEKGYDKRFNVAVTTTAATTGLMIPPSNIMIVYAVAAGNVSISAMFIAGIIPGIVVGMGIMLVCAVMSIQRGYGAGERATFREAAIAFKRAVLSLLLVVIVLGGILGGVFSATEAAAIAVAYSFVLAVWVYKQVKMKDLSRILLQSGKTTAVVMLLIGTSKAMSWILAYQNIPQTVSEVLLGVSENPIMIFVIINLLLLFVGTFMDMTPAVLIFTPIFLPVVVELGMHPVHFGVMMIANLCIGLCTPPVGTCLFLGCGVGKISIAQVTSTLIPFFIAMFVALMLITYWPALTMVLPQLFGLV
ncbi:MAG: tripartite ATP-independent transporter DctM subunit [Candidatus Latescibacterota bacterium]|jgi:tripartite ATP-independent transporter DctM subunit